MRVYNMDRTRLEDKEVHAHLSVGVLDYIARMNVKTSLRSNSMQWETNGKVPERPRCVQVTREWMTIGSPAVAFKSGALMSRGSQCG